MSLKEILEKMGAAAKRIHELAATAAEWSAEETQEWERVNKDYDALKAQKESIERSEQITTRAAEVAAYAGQQRSTFGRTPDDAAGGDDGPTDLHRALSLQAWADPRGDYSEAQQEALQRTGYNANASQITLRIPGGTEDARGWSRPSRVQRLQHLYRMSHPSMTGERIEELREKWREERDLEVGVATEGGNLVPTGFITQLEISLLAFGGMLQVADVMDTPTGIALPWPTANDTANEGEIIDEEATIGTSVDPVFGQIVFNAYKFSSKLIKTSTELLEDSAFNLSAILAAMIGERIGRHGNSQFTTGSGSGAPNGIITASSAGLTTASGVAIADTEIYDLIHSVDPAYRVGPGVRFMMHDNIILYVRKLKDSNGAFVWQPGLALGRQDTLAGYGVTVNQHMASAVAVNNKTMIFGDLSKYKVRRVRTIRLRRLDELYAANDQIGFIGFLRMDGDLLDAGTDPVKHMLQAAA